MSEDMLGGVSGGKEVVSGRHRLPNTASARRGVCQTASGRRLLTDTVTSRHRLPDTVLQTLSAGRQIRQMPSADAVCQMPCLPDSLAEVSARRHVCQRAIWQTLSSRRRLPDTVLQTLSVRH